MTEPGPSTTRQSTGDGPITPAPPNSDLLENLVDAVLSVPGVLRLEPTLHSSLRRLSAGLTQRIAALRQPDSTTGAADGITISGRQFNGEDPTIHVTIDIATSTDVQARQVAAAVHAAVATHLQQRGHAPGPIRVNVLSIEPNRHLTFDDSESAAG